MKNLKNLHFSKNGVNKGDVNSQSNFLGFLGFLVVFFFLIGNFYINRSSMIELDMGIIFLFGPGQKKHMFLFLLK